MSEKFEKRTFGIQNLRAEQNGDKRTVAGHAAVFEQLSENLGFFREIREKIRKGAFENSIKSNDIRAFWNHNQDIVLGRNKSGSLKLSEDPHGLSFELDLADTQAGKDAFISIQRGDVSAMSFGFRVIRDEMERPKDDDAPIIRTLLEIDLIEISPVVFPAYPQTNVQARNLDDVVKEQLKKWEEEDVNQKKNKIVSSNYIKKLERDLDLQKKSLR